MSPYRAPHGLQIDAVRGHALCFGDLDQKVLILDPKKRSIEAERLTLAELDTGLPCFLMDATVSTLPTRTTSHSSA